MTTKYWGQSTIINLYDCQGDVLVSPPLLKIFILELCRVIKMKPYGNLHIKRFGKGSLEGYSLMQFIETSSVTAHVDEERGRVFLDIFSCRRFKSKEAATFAKNFFNAGRETHKTIYRG
jgi:S-adenosylmethionine/arginine decarboxylase-like enzyme